MTDDDKLNEISFSPVSPYKIEKLLSEINPNKTCGPDGIPGKVLKECASSLAYPLSIQFQLTYKSGIVHLNRSSVLLYRCTKRAVRMTFQNNEN